MADYDEIVISVELYGQDGDSTLKVEERLPASGSLAELSGIFHQVHELAERIRNEQAGLRKPADPPQAPQGFTRSRDTADGPVHETV